MMPGQVELSFGTSEHLAAMNSLRQTWKSAGASKRGPELLAAFTDLGLDSELTWVEGGCAVHGIVRAPRSDGVEALVIVAAGQGDNRTNSEAVGLLGGLALYAAEQTYWAKDVIFLATDAGEIGVQEWLRAYHGEQGRMLERSGSIQAALALELPEGDGKMVGGLALHFEGRGGELPNLDFLNIVQYMARLEHIPAYLHGLSEPPSGSSAIEKYWSALRQLLLQARGQAVGAATGVHMQFLSYGIDALTIHGIERVGSRYAKSVVSVGRLTEATLRSLNNLLERFHQSFFYYLLPENGRFISIANYVPATVLFAAALMIHAMLLWYLQGPESLRSEDPKSRIERILNSQWWTGVN
ncbi:Glycosylphosphatidylinositol anchor attachment 1 protein [Coemansia sp. Benny D115]|nr:Glycosylphosphatidylinositol anchor attachment 1 protein [Coemansia sp. Benny D115]